MRDLKLIDRIRHLPEQRIEDAPKFIVPGRLGTWVQHQKQLSAIVREPNLPVIVVDDVKTYMSDCGKSQWVPAEDFPILAPPYPNFWMEHHTIARPSDPRVRSMKRGFLFRCGTVSGAPILRQWLGDSLPPEAHWVYLITPYEFYGTDIPHAADIPPYTLAEIVLCVDAKGRQVGWPCMMSLANQGDEFVMNQVNDLHKWLPVPLFALYLMHCKKLVTLEDSPVLPPKLAKRTEERLGFKPTRYKTLVIEPLKAVLRREGKSDQVGVQRALHHCRGHFVTYTEERPLFGKVTGTFWVPLHFRGVRKPDQTGPLPREIEVKV